MKIKELVYQTPEMSEEKLLNIINKTAPFISRDCKNRLFQLHHTSDIAEAILDEYDLIQAKQSHLTKSQREQITGLVSYCLIEMVKDDRSKD